MDKLPSSKKVQWQPTVSTIPPAPQTTSKPPQKPANSQVPPELVRHVRDDEPLQDLAKLIEGHPAQASDKQPRLAPTPLQQKVAILFLNADGNSNESKLVAKLVNETKGLLKCLTAFSEARFNEHGNNGAGLRERALLEMLIGSAGNPDLREAIDFLAAGRNFDDASKWLQGTPLDTVNQLSGEITAMLKTKPFAEILKNKEGLYGFVKLSENRKPNDAPDKAIIALINDTSTDGKKRASEILDFLLVFSSLPRPSGATVAATQWDLAGSALKKWAE